MDLAAMIAMSTSWHVSLIIMLKNPDAQTTTRLLLDQGRIPQNLSVINLHFPHPCSTPCGVFLVTVEGLEPSYLSIPVLEADAYTNSATLPYVVPDMGFEPILYGA